MVPGGAGLLRQQLFERAAGDLAVEATELGARDGQVLCREAKPGDGAGPDAGEGSDLPAAGQSGFGLTLFCRPILSAAAQSWRWWVSYAELAVTRSDPTQRFPGLHAQFMACGPCTQDLESLLAAITSGSSSAPDAR